ncbi:unnamed protein product [Heterobilharzia americana]|nr:unnamed protein product [Heterobilharzia americana]CAH8564118.1 unnamed protein product [Heterobilharzia americana]
MSSEDCENELLALESIYEDRYQLVQTTPKRKVKICLDGQSDDSLLTKIRCQILFELPDKYPNEPPEFQIRKPENLSEEDISDINHIINGVIERSLGYVMLFDILSDIQQKLDSVCEKLLLRQRNEAKEKRKAVQLEEEAKFRGDRVTVESFLEWNAKFRAEMQSIKEKLISEEQSNKRLTGRELFLKDSHYDDSDLTFLETNGGEVVEIDEHLFIDIGDIDLNDDDDEDNNGLTLKE